MATKNPEPGDSIAGRAPDPFVAARVPDPGTPPPPTLTLAGLLGDSDRIGRRRLYLNTRLDYYVEFQNADVVAVEAIGAELPPFVGLDATSVTLLRDAQVDYVHSRVAGAGDPFAIDLRAGATGSATTPAQGIYANTNPELGDCPSGWTVCKPAICHGDFTDTCNTGCNQNTCQTCNTQCNQNTCQGTCQTCNTHCNQNNCQATRVGQDACTEFGNLCPTYAQTHCFSCRCNI